MQTGRGRAIIVGGSIGGLFCALLLRRKGWDVAVHERAGDGLSGRGAGIVTHPALIDALAAVGLQPGEALGVEIEYRRTFAPDGSLVAAYRCPQTATSWNRLFRMLRDAFPAGCYHPGREFVRCELSDQQVVAHFADGSSDDADLLVGADGIRSTVRRHVFPETVPVYAGYVAWRGLVDEAALPPDVHRDLFPYFAFCLPPGEQMLGYPVAGPGDDLRPGHRCYNFVWYRPADEGSMLSRLLTDDDGRQHALSIPPPLISPGAIEEMRAHAARILAPQFRELVDRAEHPFLQPIYDLESPRIARSRVAMVGDAAFVARPHLGAGVTKAMQDALSLVAALVEEADIPAALARFEGERVRAGLLIVDRARRLGSYIRTRFRNEAERALAERHRTPQAVMRQTALLDVLGD